jgi:acyl carrier protein
MAMDETKIWERMSEIFCEVFEDEDLQIGPNTTADDIEDWDSLTNIELLVEIERAFEMRFNTGEVANLSNVGEMVGLIVGRAGAKD